MICWNLCLGVLVLDFHHVGLEPRLHLVSEEVLNTGTEIIGFNPFI